MTDAGPLRLPVARLPLADAFARRITYLRISLTDRCNYRCTYCMPEEGVTLLPREEILSLEELVRVVAIFTRLGVRSVRLTGGEPTVRRGLLQLVDAIASVPGIDDLALSTNGERLAELAADLRRAGLARLNVSLDTLDAEKFRRITRRGDLARVLEGIEAARAAGFPAIKTNTVALAGFNDGEIGALCRWAWERDVVPRFIEPMPMAGGALFVPGSLMAAADIRAAVVRQAADADGKLVPDDPGAVRGAGPARYFRLESPGERPHNPRRVGIISALTEHFCDTCNRVRLSAVGGLHTCLAHDDAIALRPILRSGDDAAVERAIRAAVEAKPAGHEFQTSGCGGPRKHMVSIGG